MDSSHPATHLVRIYSALNENEASIIEQALSLEGIVVKTDITAGSGVFGGLPFESGHHVLVPEHQATQALAIIQELSENNKSAGSAGDH